MAGARLFSLLGLGLIFASCGRDVPDAGGGRSDQTLFVDPPAFDLYLGHEFTFDVVLGDEEAPKSVLGTEELAIEVGNAGVVELRKDGTGTAMAAGQSALIAAYLGLQAEALIQVRDGNLIGIEIVPEKIRLQIGQTTQIRVTGNLDDGEQLELSRAYQGTGYVSSDPSIATVTKDGLVRAEKNGRAIVSVTHGDFSGEVEVEVAEMQVVLTALRIEPAQLSLEQSESFQLGVFGIDAAGNEIDLIATFPSYPVAFTSSDPAVATVSETARITALRRTGVTTIIATLGDLTASAEIRVRPPESDLVDLIVQPGMTDLREGGVVQLRVTGRYRDGSTEDLTAGSSGTTYRSSDPNAVSVGENGLATGKIRGRSAFITVRHGIFERTVFINVTGDADLIGLEVRPPFIDLEVGGFLQLQVLALYSDGSSIDVTAASSGVAYLPPRDGFITVSPDGFVQANFAGAGNLVVRYAGFEVFVPVTVIDRGQIIGIFISPPFISVPENGVAFVQIFAQLSDGSIIDITFDPSLFVSIDRPRVAAYVGPGLVEGRSAGLTTLRASYFGFVAQADVEVAGMRTLIEISLSIPPRVQVNQTASYSVLGFYSDGSVQDITFDPATQVVSVDPAILDVFFGTATGIAPGFALVIADHAGFSDSATVEVATDADPIVAISFQPSSLSLPVGGIGTTRLTAIHQSGTVTDITFDPNVVYSPGGPISATLSPGGLEIGGFAPGPAEVIATYQGLNARLDVEIGTMTQLVGIDIVAPARIGVFSVETFIVVAFFSDGSFIDITFDPGLALSSSNTMFFTVAPGAVTGVSAGTADIVATYQGLTDTHSLTVGNDPVVALEFEPASLQMQVGVRATAQVFATFASGRRVNVTFDPNLNINFNGPINILPGPGAEILIDASAAGSASITASYDGFNATLPIQISNNDPIVALAWNPAQLALAVGGSDSAQVIALFASGSSLDVTGDPATTLSKTGPITIALGPGGLQVTGNAQGNGQVTAQYMGFSAGLPVTVGSAPTLSRIRVEPSSVLVAEGDTVQLLVVGVYSDGSESPITGATFINFDPSVAEISPTGLVTGLSVGTGGALVSFGMFTELVQIDVFSVMGPTITSIAPTAILAGSPPAQLTVNGTGFAMGDAIFIDGFRLTTTFVSATELAAQVPAFLTSFPDTLDVQVRGPNGRSNIVPLLVGELPDVTSYSPDSLFQGSSVDVTIIGSGLANLSYSGSGLTISERASSVDGSWVRIRVTAPASVMPGLYTVGLSNALGMDSIDIEVLATQNLPDLVVSSGQTVMLSGTNVYANVTVQTGGRIVGTGLDTLAIIASNDITIRGTIDVSGDPGEPGFTTPSAGGDAGPGGAGGGGGGDGDAMNPASGGAGSPPGMDAWPGFGTGTPGGDGGGEGAGGAGAFGCGHGGGGGALGGGGGSGGGDFGAGTGGFGGLSGGRGSTYGHGTGGGGGSTCGNASGGGGGGGGGGLILQVAPGGTILIDGAIRADGGDGGDGFQNTGGGGGGSGGRIDVIATNGSITVNDTIRARGGRGGDTDFGDTGGGGGGGVIVIDATGGTANVGLGLLDAGGGQPGTSLGNGFPGEPGSSGQTTITP